MGNSQSVRKINFEDVQLVIKNPESYLLITTLTEIEDICLIKDTIPIKKEETIINNCLYTGKNKKIILYGKNANDDSVYKKYKQLLSLGFYNVFIYIGGIFEWLLLQDIYGFEEFPTTIKIMDILKYKSTPQLSIYMLENG
jgi:hypothetical protein